MEIRVKFSSIPHLLSFVRCSITNTIFIIYTYFTHIAASSTVTDDVTN